MTADMMLSPVAAVLCGACRCRNWGVGDPLLNYCRCCERHLGAFPYYALVWDDRRAWG